MQLLLKQTNTRIARIIFAIFLLLGFKATAQCTATGDQQTYGQGQWIGYVYSNGSSFTAPPANVTAFTYRGYTTQTESFDLNLGSGAISGANICGTYADYFTTRFKMNKNYTPGYYTITVSGDDGFRFSTDGGATWNSSLSDWAAHGYNTRSATVLLSGSTNLVLEYFEYTGSARVTFGITALPCASTAPTAVSGTTALDCNNRTTTLTASGGTAGYLSTFEWGMGTVAGQNTISGQTSASISVTPSVTTTYWVRRANGSPCGGYSDAIYKIVTVSGAVGDPTAFGNNTWNVYGYNGANLDVNSVVYNGYYTQSTLGFDSTLAWGSDYSPSSAANWQGCTLPNDQFTFVHKRKGFPCGRYTLTMTRWDDDAVVYVNGTQVWNRNGWSGGLTNEVVGTYDLDATSTIEVRVREAGGGANGAMTLTPTTAPTGVSGVTSLGCSVRSTTLTATGGYAAGSTVYQWGTGSVVGENVITGQTTASITVSPTATTTYWVRLANMNNCGNYYSNAATTTVNVNVPPGNPATFPSNQWNAYAYVGTSLTLSDAAYYGYYTQNTLGVSTTTGTNSWAKELSPSAAAGYQGCAIPNDNFVYVYKRQGFPCGMYQINFTFWDDDAELYIDGTRVWSKGAWSGETAVNDNAGSFRLGENTTVELRVREVAGVSQVTMNLTLTTTLNVAPTAINGPSTTQCGAAATLTATGGTLGTGSAYQWGTGAVGSNVIANATTASVSVSPQTTTTYWARIKTACNTYTTAVTFTVTANVTVAGTLSATSTTACKNSVPGAITLSGNNGNVVKWQTADDANFTQNVTDIANTTTVLAPAQIGIISANKYFRAVVQYAGCNQVTTTALLITVPAPVVWNGSWSSTPSINTAVEVQSDLTLDADLTVCSCHVKNTATLTVNSAINLTVKGKVTVDPTAKMIVQNNASLIQIDDVANLGNIEIHRNSSLLKRLDYTIWSSPVDNQQLLAFSPQTVTTRFYQYKTTNNTYSTVSPEGNFETAKGYLIRTPNTHPTTATVYAGMFTGTPHNGTITKELVRNEAGESYNGVGNPYPSPISFNEFINANLNNIEGTVWAWRKTNDYTQSSYTIITKFAYVANAAPGGENNYAVDPHGVLNTGQGFIVKAKPAGGNLVFTNAMRIGNSSNQFFRTVPSTASKFWFNVTDASGSFSQAMVGYTDEATLDYDNGIDGRAMVDNNINLYTIQAENKLAIHGRPEFTATDVVPVGFKANAAGSYTFTLGNTEGLFTGNTQAIYLVDSVEGVAVNLKAHAYTFTAEAGTFDNRFRIAYTTTTLDTEAPVKNENNVVVYGKAGQLSVVSDEPMASVAVYDILGRELVNKANLNAVNFEAATGTSDQVLIVKIKLVSGKTAERKVFLN
nr:T9SS sorting signal type C domain-containing protein [uncultured Flavobacterium sp.]